MVHNGGQAGLNWVSEIGFELVNPGWVFRAEVRRREVGVSNVYYMLIASLPPVPPTFQVDRLPISQPRLAQRLEMLQPEDMATLQELADFLQWERQPLDRSDEEVFERYQTLWQNHHNAVIRQLVTFQMDLRTLMSGLRRRRAGQGPPAGVGQCVDSIQRHFDHPDFRLGFQFPWLARVDQLLAAGKYLEVERQLIQATWNFRSRLAEQYEFSFEAVVLYLARWDLIQRWISQDRQRGQARFEELLRESLGEFASLFPVSVGTVPVGN